MLVDTHAHLEGIEDPSVAMAAAREAGVRAILAVGSGYSSNMKTLELSQQYAGCVFPAFGLHPWFTGNRSATWIDRLQRLLETHPDATLGEIGLDHALDQRNDAEQAEVFIAQLKLARALHRPVSMHCRRAWGEIMRILEQQCGLPDGGAIHSFSGPLDLIAQCERLNVSLSFSGSITHDRNKKGAIAAAAVSPCHLLIETDSPDIPPSGVGQGQNEPALLPRVAQRLAEIRELLPEKMAEQTCTNAVRIFGPRG